MLRTGTYLREPDGATQVYYSPYSFNDATENFRVRKQQDGWSVVRGPDSTLLWKAVHLQPGEYVYVKGGKIV